ncbi:MAG: hypothetical protein J2P23_05405 [Microlunatus sp.]|nr:hypothetical protein [Microlunatus sp.]
MISADVLGIGVDDLLIERWRGWFAPSVQPFRTDLLPPQVAAAVPNRRVEPTPEWTDTFFMYGGTWTWLCEEEFNALRPSLRRSLLAVRRRTVRPKLMPVWPSELARSGDDLMFRWVASGAVRPSRHDDVPGTVWKHAQAVLPAAERLAGTFAAGGSGANCFGTVLAATGLDVDDIQIGPDRFQVWLDEHTERITGTSCDDRPGVVFVWTEHEDLAHATVTIGDGWMLSKPSQSWSSPRLVRTVREAVNAWRYPHTRLARYRICR